MQPYSGTKKRKGMKVRLKPEKTNKGFNVNLWQDGHIKT